VDRQCEDATTTEDIHCAGQCRRLDGHEPMRQQPFGSIDMSETIHLERTANMCERPTRYWAGASSRPTQVGSSHLRLSLMGVMETSRSWGESFCRICQTKPWLRAIDSSRVDM